MFFVLYRTDTKVHFWKKIVFLIKIYMLTIEYRNFSVIINSTKLKSLNGYYCSKKYKMKK